MRRFLLPAVVAVGTTLAACAPALDWREFQAEGSGIVTSFPCKPDRHVRNLTLAAQAVRMEMLVCSADDVTFAVSFADLSDPSRVGPTLEEMRSLAVSNIAALRSDGVALQVPGMTPNPQASRLRIEGRRPDGLPVQEQAAFFAKGLRVYQATVLGKQVPAGAADIFIGGLRLPG